jgi:DNA-binding XRE family transcriptional regulator
MGDIVKQKKSRRRKFMSEISDRIRNLRKAKGLRQNQLASITGFSQSLISEVEHRIKPVTNDLILAIRDNLHISEHWLRTGEGPMQAPAPNAPTCPECSKVVALDDHQRLVERFRQKELAKRINRHLVEIEELEPERISEIASQIEALRNVIIGRQTKKTRPTGNERCFSGVTDLWPHRCRPHEARVEVDCSGRILRIRTGEKYPVIAPAAELIGLTCWDDMGPADAAKLHASLSYLRPGGPTVRLGFCLIFNHRSEYRFATIMMSARGAVFLKMVQKQTEVFTNVNDL